MSTVWRAFAKVNLDLRIVGRRGDGYHEIRTILQAIDLNDEIHVSPSKSFSFTATEGPRNEENLVVRAVRAFEAETSITVSLRLDLDKRIPSGGGLGGGSADAAATLMGLSRWYGVQLPGERLHQLLAGLGSDVPFFALGGRALGIGRGERLFPLPDDADYRLLLVDPGLSIPTTEAYSWLTLSGESNNIFCFCARFVPPQGSVEPFRDFLLNDFEMPLFRRYPELDEIKRKLSASGAYHAALTGSGGTIFGRFRNQADADKAAADLGREFDVKLARPLRRSEYFSLMFEESPDLAR